MALRVFAVICLMFLSCSVGAAGATYRASLMYEKKLERIQEERESYMAIANSAVSMSDKAFAFAQGYQEVLDTCMQRLYSSPVESPVAASRLKKGGVGGPVDVRKQDRLP